MGDPQRTTYVLIDGENIDATLGTSILGRRPRPDERPRWERVLQFARERWGQPARGLFFLAANNELPMAFVQALLAIGYRPVALSGGGEGGRHRDPADARGDQPPRRGRAAGQQRR